MADSDRASAGSNAGKEPPAYDIAPSEHPPTPKIDLKPATKPAATPSSKIDKPSVLEGFDDDADFNKDPELDRAILGNPRPPRTVDDPLPDDFIKPGIGDPIHWAAAGGAMLLATLIIVPVRATNVPLLRTADMLYGVLLHTATGVVALYVAAALVRKIVGRPELAAARMFAAVSAAALIYAINPKFVGHLAADNAIRMALAVLAYGLVVLLGFRLWRTRELKLLIGTHALIWLIIQIALELAAAVARAPMPPKGP